MDFQFLKKNSDGSIDIELPHYMTHTVPHPIGEDGKPLSGATLIYALEKYIEKNINLPAPNVIDPEIGYFIEEYYLDEVMDESGIDYGLIAT